MLPYDWPWLQRAIKRTKARTHNMEHERRNMGAEAKRRSAAVAKCRLVRAFARVPAHQWRCSRILPTRLGAVANTSEARALNGWGIGASMQLPISKFDLKSDPQTGTGRHAACQWGDIARSGLRPAPTGRERTSGSASPQHVLASQIRRLYVLVHGHPSALMKWPSRSKSRQAGKRRARK